MIDIAKKNLTRGLESTLDKLPISDGKIRFTTDTGRLFLDCGTALRIEISDFVKGMTESQIKSNMIPLPKFYYAYDTQRLFYHNGTTWVQVNNHVEFADKDGVGNNIKDTYAPKNSPSLSGTPTTPTPSSSSSGSMIANKEYVDNIIKNSVGGVTQIEYTVVTSLPTTGEKGKIYFVLNGSTDTTNIYNEYVWINNKFELLGAIQMEFSTDFGDLDE